LRKRTTIIWLLAGASLLPAEIIDRIAVSVGNQVITAGDLDREIRVTAFLNASAPDFAPESRRRTADLMVRQRLVRREVELARYPSPDAADVDPVLRTFQQENYPNPGGYAAALGKSGVADGEVREHILRQLTFLKFINLRFRAAVHVQDEDVEAYFKKAIEPAARAVSGGEPVALDDYRERIVEILTEQQTDKELDHWIREAIKRTVVAYRTEVFQP
jgi:hypothetical protein